MGMGDGTDVPAGKAASRRGLCPPHRQPLPEGGHRCPPPKHTARGGRDPAAERVQPTCGDSLPWVPHLGVLLAPKPTQNDRITECWGWKGPLGVTQSNPLPKQGHPQQAAQHRGQGGLNISREGDSPASLGSLGQGSVTLRGKKFFLMFRWNSPAAPKSRTSHGSHPTHRPLQPPPLSPLCFSSHFQPGSSQSATPRAALGWRPEGLDLLWFVSVQPAPHRWPKPGTPLPDVPPWLLAASSPQGWAAPRVFPASMGRTVPPAPGPSSGCVG